MSVQNNPQAERSTFNDVDSAADAILSKWEETPEQEQSENEEEAAEAENDETVQGDLFDNEEAIETEEVDLEDTEDPDEADEDEAEEYEYEDEDGGDEPLTASDDLPVEITVGDDTHQVSVGELKRLYGQEASLTRKSQDLAQQRKQAEANIEKTHVVLQKMLEKAEQRYEPYKDVDMLVAAKEMATEDFAQLRKDAQSAESDLKFLREEADQFYADLKSQQQATLQAQAQEALKVLREDIPEWNNELYNNIRSFAVSEGLPQEQVDNFVDPVVIKILHKARMYDEGKKVAAVKKTKPKSSKKVLKTRSAPPTKADRRTKAMQDARKNLRTSRDLDDVASVLMSRWET